MIRGVILSVTAGMIGALCLPLTIALFAFLNSWNDAEMIGLIAEGVGIAVAGCFAMVVANLIFVVLPLTAYLSRTGRERAATYCSAGLLIGLCEVILIVMLMAGDWSAIIFYAIGGAIAAFAMALTWWHACRRDRQGEPVLPSEG